MSAWIVYSKDGLAKCEARKLEYSGEFMGACSVSINVSAPTPIGFEIGDWLEYRGERFELNYDPSVVKESSSNTYGEGFVYDNVVFNSLSDELTRCDFLDVVPADNGMHYSSLPTFSFFAESVSVLAERIQENLNRVYTGDKAWKVMVHPEFVSTKNVNVSASNLTCWDALALAKSQFDANFIIKGRTITIGTSGIAVGNLFAYGKGNGLYSIEKNAESSQKIITRLRAYGSTRNIPSGYYRKIGENVPNNMAVQNLMLPSFPTETLDPYLDSKNIEELGVREGTVFFDGSGDLEEIYPTMEGMTAEELKEAGVNVDAEGALDVVVSAEQIEDDGIIPEEGEIQKSFTITLKDIGFDINEYLSASGTATISMKDGMCGGREFEIAECKKDGSNYVLTCNRSEDSGLGLVFPYKDYQIKGGDKFVLLNLEMPDVYIKVASQRLLAAATEYLSKNDYVRYSYTPSVDNIYLARQHDEAVSNGLKSIHDTIKEGDFILFEDDDFGISGSITIDSLSIKEYADESIIPEYEFTLREEKSVGTIEKIQNQISSILNGSAGGSVNTEQVKSIVSAVGGSMFLSKQKDDRSKGKISSDKGFEAGEFIPEVAGAACYQDKDGNWHIETDHLKVRKKASFTEVEIETTYHVGGQQISTGASMVVDYVLEMDSCYRCYFLKKDNNGRVTTNKWKPKDQAYCNTFNLVKQEDGTLSNHYLWRLVDATSNETADDAETRVFGDVTINTADYHFTDLSKTVFAEGSDIPKVMDEIVLLGHQGNDESRQGCIIVAGAGEGSPYIYEFTGIGIEPFTLPEPETKIKPNDNMFTGVMRIQGNSTGAANLTDLNIGAVNLLLNSGFTGDYKAEDLDETYNLKSGTELFSRGMKHWSGKAAIVDDREAVSGKSAKIGWLTQSVFLIKRENYVVSFKAKGVSVNVSVGNKVKKQELTSNYEHYSLKFVSDGVSSFTISGDATICDLQLERGIVATDWNPSPYDNDKALAALRAVKYLQDAICEGDTTILGGLILSSMIQLGNYKDGKMQKVNAGMSGIYNDDDDVAFWGGGTFEEAIKTMMKFRENPNCQPKPEDWSNLAKFVVTHGGDLFLRGTIFAENGYFRGRLEQGNGATILERDGSGNLANGAISWNPYGVMYRRAYDVIVWRKITDSPSAIDLNLGTYLDLTGYGSTYTLPNATFDGTPLYLRWEPMSRSHYCAILQGSFKAKVKSDGKITYQSANKLTLYVEDKDIQLKYSTEESAWIYEGAGVIINENGLMIIDRVVESETEIVADKVTSNSFAVGGRLGITQTIPVYENGGRSYFTFTGGILTAYKYEPNEE